MKCKYCGARFDGNYCPKCGAKVSDANDYSFGSTKQKKSNKGVIILLWIIILGCLLSDILDTIRYMPVGTRSSLPKQTQEAIRSASEYFSKEESTKDTVKSRNISFHALSVTYDYDLSSLYVRVSGEITNISNEEFHINSFTLFSLNNDGVIDDAAFSYENYTIEPGISMETTLIFIFPETSNTDFSKMDLTVDGKILNLGDTPIA